MAAKKTAKKSTKRGIKTVRAPAAISPKDDIVLKHITKGETLTSKIASKTGLTMEQVRVSVRKLKAHRKIYQGGERRFARYATTQAKASAASTQAQHGGK